MLQALRSWGGVTDNIPTRFLPFLYGNGMRAVHLHKDISPPYSEVFRGLCRANPVRLARKGKRGKTSADYGANRAGKAGGSRSWGGGGKPREGGEKQK